MNGQLIQLHMQYTGQALEILLRKESRLDLYGPDGRSTTSGDRRIDDSV
ncbi:MAG: flagellar protein FlgN [Candidatus Accumulibacter sp.]|nr:flagellar protein FlgN [Accumulibacter sp.]